MVGYKDQLIFLNIHSKVLKMFLTVIKHTMASSTFSSLTLYRIYLLKFEASVRLCAPWSQKALTLYPATDCAAATDIRCRRSLAVKPLTMSGSPSHRGSVRRASRSQVTHVPISNCSCSMCAMTVSKLISTCGNYTAARRAATAAARLMGAFSTGVSVDWGLSQRPARVDCGLSYTTGQAPQSREARLWLVNFKLGGNCHREVRIT